MASDKSDPVKEKPRVGDVFYCRSKRRKMLLTKCLEDYVEANAFQNNKSVCYQCAQGQVNRESFANS